MNLLRKLLRRLRGELPIETLMKRGLRIGRHCHIMEQVTLDPSHCWLIDIGHHVTLAPGVRVFAHDASMHRALGYSRIAPVRIGNGTFVGANSIILPGVTIGDRCVIGAGSVVTNDIADGTVAAGNPAAPLMPTNLFIEKHRTKLQTAPKFDTRYTVQRGITRVMKEEMQKALRKKSGYVK